MASVLITGTNRGIGLEFVKKLLARGDQVIATCRDVAAAKSLQALQAGGANLQIVALDVSSSASMAALAEQLKGQAIDVLINNAGVYGPRDSQFGKLDAEAWSAVMEVNAIAPILLTQYLMANLQQGKARKLIYISSKMGSIDDNSGGGSYIYRSSKSALNSAVKSLSVDLAADGFSVAVLHPGWVQTDMGGPSALINTDTSVSGMLGVIDNLDQASTGSFFNYDGAIIPW
jgi:NAD(P)-dependent dehydrogenase (short-subunit alcohol dehydrogenase family)